jgi:hypothetical protein
MCFIHCRKKHPALYNIFQNGMDPDICRNVALYGYLKLCKEREHDLLGYVDLARSPPLPLTPGYRVFGHVLFYNNLSFAWPGLILRIPPLATMLFGHVLDTYTMRIPLWRPCCLAMFLTPTPCAFLLWRPCCLAMFLTPHHAHSSSGDHVVWPCS